MPEAGRGGRIVVVCRANICRSPTVALVLRRHLGAASGIEVDTAGWDPVTGGRWCPPMADALAHLTRPGMTDPPSPADWADRHRARAVVVADVQDNDLVLAADLMTRAEIARRDPSGTARLFTVVEAAALAAVAADGRTGVTADLRELVEEMDASRGTVHLPTPRTSRWARRVRPGLDLPDAHAPDAPWRHDRLADHLQSTTSSLARSLLALSRD